MLSRPHLDWWADETAQADVFAFVELESYCVWLVETKHLSDVAQQHPKGRFISSCPLTPKRAHGATASASLTTSLANTSLRTRHVESFDTAGWVARLSSASLSNKVLEQTESNGCGQPKAVAEQCKKDGKVLSLESKKRTVFRAKGPKIRAESRRVFIPLCRETRKNGSSDRATLHCD
jgi:hypothetical protein